MKESNILTSNATIKEHQKEILLDTKGQHIKEFDYIVISNTLLWQMKVMVLFTRTLQLQYFAGNENKLND